MLAEVLAVFLVASFIFAYLYKATPEDNSYFKMLFVILSLFMLFSASWVLLKPQDFGTTATTYNATTNETLTTVTTLNNVNGTAMQNFLAINTYTIMVSAILVFTILVIMYLWNTLLNATNLSKERNTKGYKD